MTDTEKLTMLKAMTGEKDESVLSTYLSIAGNKVLKRAYPFDSTVTVVQTGMPTIKWRSPLIW